MGSFKRLSVTSRLSEGAGETHQHVVYLDEERGEGRVSIEDDHDHQVILQEAQLDEAGNVVQEGGWVVVPDPMDGHTHNLEDIRLVYPKSNESDEDKVSMVLNLFRTAYEFDQESLDKAEEADDFYSGEGQWTQDQKSYLENLKRACLTLNYTQKHIDELVGYYRQQLTEWRFMPVGGGDQVTADIFNYLAKHVAEQSNFEMEDVQTFEDMAIGGRGNFNLFMDFSQDMRGELKIENYPRDQVVYGPHQKLDASDCEYLVKHKMVSLGKLKQLAPKKWKQIEKDFDTLSVEMGKPKVAFGYTGDQYAQSDDRRPAVLTTANGDLPLADVARKEYRIMECWQFVYLKVPVAGVPADDFYLALWGWKKDDLNSIRLIPGVGVVDRVLKKIRVTRVCGKTILVDENPADLPVDEFFTIPAYAKKKGGRFWGKVESVKDVQRELNYRRSQMVDIGNKMVSYGWFGDDTTFADETEEQRFMETNSSPGWYVRLQDVNKPPQQVEGIKFPGELAQMSQLAADDVAQLMNIQVTPEGANDSAKKLMQMQQYKLLGNEFLFDNVKLAKKKLGRLLVPLLQKYYKTRAYRILQDQRSKQNVELGGRPLEEFSEEDITAALNNAEAMKYDLVVSEVSSSPTQRALILSMLTELMQAGQPVPFDAYIKFTDLPEHEKNEVIQSFMQQQQATSQGENEKQVGEVEKVMMSKGIITPNMASKYGIPEDMVTTGPVNQDQQQPDPNTPDPNEQALAA